MFGVYPRTARQTWGFRYHSCNEGDCYFCIQIALMNSVSTAERTKECGAPKVPYLDSVATSHQPFASMEIMPDPSHFNQLHCETLLKYRYSVSDYLYKPWRYRGH